MIIDEAVNMNAEMHEQTVSAIESWRDAAMTKRWEANFPEGGHSNDKAMEGRSNNKATEGRSNDKAMTSASRKSTEGEPELKEEECQEVHMHEDKKARHDDIPVQAKWAVLVDGLGQLSNEIKAGKSLHFFNQQIDRAFRNGILAYGGTIIGGCLIGLLRSAVQPAFEHALFDVMENISNISDWRDE